MIRNLPEGSRFVAAMAVDNATDDDAPPPPADPRTEAVMDHRLWTLDRRLMAMEINTLNALITVSANWKDGKAPDFATVGPEEWRKGDKSKSNELKDNFDVLRKMGWPGG